MAQGILLGIAWFAVFLITHVMLFHFRGVWKRFQAILNILLGSVTGELSSLWLIAEKGAEAGGRPEQLMLGAVSGVVVILGLWVLYMPFYYVVVSSTSVQTLVAIHRAPGQELELSKLYDMFASTTILRRRLEMMVDYGNLVREGEGWGLTRKGQVTARVFGVVKKIWRLGPGG